ncbi:MAG: uncharacterized protein KVP18_002881, partial [Porospora cf. gigantea A]
MSMYFKGDACQALGYCLWVSHGNHGHCDLITVCDALNASNIESSLKEGVCGETNQCHWDAASTKCVSGADSVSHDYTDEQKIAFCGAIASNDMTMYFQGDACQALGYCSWTPHGNHGHCDFVDPAVLCGAIDQSNMASAAKQAICGETDLCHWDDTSCVKGKDTVDHDYTNEQKESFCTAVVLSDMSVGSQGDVCDVLQYCSWTLHGDHGHCDFSQTAFCGAIDASSMDSALKQAVCGETNKCHWETSSCVEGKDTVDHEYTLAQKKAFCAAVPTSGMAVDFQGDVCQHLGYCQWTIHGDHGHCDYVGEVGVCAAIGASNLQAALKPAVCIETHQCHWDATDASCLSGYIADDTEYTDEEKTSICGSIAVSDLTVANQTDVCEHISFCSWFLHGDHGHCEFGDHHDDSVPVGHLVGAGIVILLVGALGAFMPLYIRRSGTGLIYFANAFGCGALLAFGMVHLLPEAVLFTENAGQIISVGESAMSIAYILCLAGFLTAAILDTTGERLGGGHGHGHGFGHDDMKSSYYTSSEEDASSYSSSSVNIASKTADIAVG